MLKALRARRIERARAQIRRMQRDGEHARALALGEALVAELGPRRDTDPLVLALRADLLVGVLELRHPRETHDLASRLYETCLVVPGVPVGVVVQVARLRAMALCALGRFAEAEAVCLAAMPQGPAWSAGEEAVRMLLEATWSQAVAAQGRNQEAAEVEAGLLARWEATGRGLEGVMMRCNMASTLATGGRYLDALDAAGSGLAALERLRAPAAARGLAEASCRNNIAFALNNLGRYQEAEEHARIAADMLARAENGDRPADLARTNHAQALLGLGAAEEAAAEARAVLGRVTATLGPRHPSRVAVLTILGGALGPGEGIPVLREAVAEADAHFGPGHWRTVRAARVLAHVAGAGAHDVLRERLAAADGPRGCGPEHPEALAAAEALAGTAT